MKPRTPKKRNPIAKRLADPRFRQRVVPVKPRQAVTKLKGAQDYKLELPNLEDA
jgi:hypothetical protein